MLFWHLGGTLAIVRYVFRDPNMDLRFVLLGSVLPDLLDKPFGAVLFTDTFHTHRLWGHTLVFPVVGLAVVLLATRRGTPLRKGLIGVVIGAFIHLFLDGVWTSPEAFLWPLFGTDFPPIPGSDLPTLLGDMLSSPLVWVGEAVGLAYLVYLWRRYLGADGDLRKAFRTGRVGMRSPA